jgi:hypothetical protein
MPAPKSKPIDPWAAIDALIKPNPEPCGPGWFTVREFAIRYGMAESGAIKRLKRMVAAGTMESWIGVSDQTRRTTCKFRPK